jgi:hypothetical protein
MRPVRDKISLVRRRRIAAGVMAVLAIAGCGGGDEEETSSTVGPDTFEGTATTLDGEQVDLATLAGEDLVVWFWAPW